MSFLFKPRQIVIMDAQSSGPARNFSLRYVTLALLLLILTVIPFMLGANYAPFHKIQEVIPENIKLKRQNSEMVRKIAEATTLNDLKDEQLSSLKEQIGLQENEIITINKQLHMYKSILDERKGTGIHVLESKASLGGDQKIEWASLFVKGGSYPRYLVGKYSVFAVGYAGKRQALNKKPIKYKIESHTFMKQAFDWKEDWEPANLELIVYNSRLKEVLKKTIPLIK